MGVNLSGFSVRSFYANEPFSWEGSFSFLLDSSFDFDSVFLPPFFSCSTASSEDFLSRMHFPITCSNLFVFSGSLPETIELAFLASWKTS